MGCVCRYTRAVPQQQVVWAWWPACADSKHVGTLRRLAFPRIHLLDLPLCMQGALSCRLADAYQCTFLPCRSPTPCAGPPGHRPAQRCSVHRVCHRASRRRSHGHVGHLVDAAPNQGHCKTPGQQARCALCTALPRPWSHPPLGALAVVPATWCGLRACRTWQGEGCRWEERGQVDEVCEACGTERAGSSPGHKRVMTTL